MAIRFDRSDPESALPQIEGILNDFIDRVYPVGCLFLTSNEKYNPNTKFGGKWELIDTNPYTWTRTR